MGLMDKVKAQAAAVAQQANAGMARLDAMPAQRHADSLLRSLGLAVLAERTGRGTGETESQISQLVTELTQHESQNNVDLVQQAAQAQAQQLQAQQARTQMQGQYLNNAPPADPNAPPGAAAPGYGGQPGFGQQGGQPGFGGQPQTGFGGPAQPRFGGPAQPGFAGQPQSGPAGFPQQAAAGAPGAGPGTPGGVPSAPTAFPAANPLTSFPQASPVDSTGTPDDQQGSGQSFFPPASGV